VISAGEAAAESASFCASTLPSHFASVTSCNSTVEARPPPPPLPAGARSFCPALVPGTKRVLPGYPTLKTLAVTPSLRPVGVEVLGQASKKDSVVLQIKARKYLPDSVNNPPNKPVHICCTVFLSHTFSDRKSKCDGLLLVIAAPSAWHVTAEWLAADLPASAFRRQKKRRICALVLSPCWVQTVTHDQVGTFLRHW
jgi:hypothetical protein